MYQLQNIRERSILPMRRSNSCLTSTASLVSESGATRPLTARVTALHRNSDIRLMCHSTVKNNVISRYRKYVSNCHSLPSPLIQVYHRKGKWHCITTNAHHAPCSSFSTSTNRLRHEKSTFTSACKPKKEKPRNMETMATANESKTNATLCRPT